MHHQYLRDAVIAFAVAAGLLLILLGAVSILDVPEFVGKAVASGIAIVICMGLVSFVRWMISPLTGKMRMRRELAALKKITSDGRVTQEKRDEASRRLTELELRLGV